MKLLLKTTVYRGGEQNRSVCWRDAGTWSRSLNGAAASENSYLSECFCFSFGANRSNYERGFVIRHNHVE